MPADAMILSTAIISVFVFFGAVLYWGEHRTRSLPEGVEEPKAKRRSF